MPADYAKISSANSKRYGTEVGSFGPVLLANLYADRTHFLFELLQNAEDALRRRGARSRRRDVHFDIGRESLTVTHFGQPFDEADVHGICGIALSTKDDSDIGRFGIGFKSVYAWTERPEVHSGNEDFAIENYVHPIPVQPTQRSPDSTVIVIPFKEELAESRGEIVEALLRDAGPALRFLSEIEEISWSVEGIPRGHFLADRRSLGQGVDHLTVVGDRPGTEWADEWLVFSDEVEYGGQRIGAVEIALSLDPGEAQRIGPIQQLHHSSLAVFFPTDHETHLRFLVQGPYRTTPSRENVLKNDRWNVDLVLQTSDLLRRSLLWLRDNDLLTVDTLTCLPIDSNKFGADNMFAPLYETTKEALGRERLLPAHPTGYVAAPRAVLGGTATLRQLFDHKQLSSVLGAEAELSWLTADISLAQTRELYDYLRHDHEVEEVAGAASLIRRLTSSFLEQQPDEWIQHLYVLLADQHAMRRAPWFSQVPLIRLADGRHVTPGTKDRPNAYLTASSGLGQPVVRQTVHTTEKANEFLASIGLRAFDPVDRIVSEVLPRYHDEDAPVTEDQYRADIAMITRVYRDESAEMQRRLVRALRSTPFVRIVDADLQALGWTTPQEAYIPTDAVQSLLRGLKDVQFVDPSVAELSTEDAVELLVECGASDGLRVVPVRYDHRNSEAEWKPIKDYVGRPRSTVVPSASDWTVEHLSELLNSLTDSAVERRAQAARLLWDRLRDVDWSSEIRFWGTYTYFYYSEKTKRFPAQFVRLLNEAEWIPAADGDFVTPADVVFGSLGWTPDRLLLEHIEFRPAPEPTVEEEALGRLAEAADIDPKLLTVVREENITMEEIEAVLQSRKAVQTGDATVQSSPFQNQDRDSHQNSAESGTSVRSNTTANRDTFHSYLAVQRESKESQPQPEQHEARMDLEHAAIDYILQLEPAWQRTPPNNPGFDLYRVDDDGKPFAWCEVKSLSGSWGERPVAMTRTQFEHAREHAESYWLYVVEYAGTNRRRILAIQDPAGQAEAYTFDSGWESGAEPLGGRQ